MRIAIKQGSIIRNLERWDEYDFVRKGTMIKKFTRNAEGNYEMSDFFQQHPFITESPYNYQIIDVDVDSIDIESNDFDCVDGVFMLNKDRRRNRVSNTQNKTALQAEHDAIKEWFVSYDIKVSEHTRCSRLGTICHHNIVALDIEAAQKQERLKNIRQVLAVL